MELELYNACSENNEDYVKQILLRDNAIETLIDIDVPSLSNFDHIKNIILWIQLFDNDLIQNFFMNSTKGTRLFFLEYFKKLENKESIPVHTPIFVPLNEFKKKMTKYTFETYDILKQICIDNGERLEDHKIEPPASNSIMVIHNGIPSIIDYTQFQLRPSKKADYLK